MEFLENGLKREEFLGSTRINVYFLKDKYTQSKMPRLSNAKKNVCASKSAFVNQACQSKNE